MAAKGSELAGLLRSLPVVLPASGSCAPLDTSQLAFKRTELEGVPDRLEIPLDHLKMFPEEPSPFELPPPTVPSAPPPPPPPPPLPVFVRQAPKPPSAWPRSAPTVATPREPIKSKKPARKWPFAIDALVFLGLVVMLSPLGKHPLVQGARGQTSRGVAIAMHGVERALDSIR
jgi:hypothetical protein